VFATDIMVAAVGGEAVAQQMFDHLLASAKDGRAPWIKYLIWQAGIYDVRHGWTRQNNSGHYDHIHVSARTDHQYTHLGSWSPVPGATQEVTMRYRFSSKIGGDNRVYITDGLRYRVQPSSADVDKYGDRAGAGPITTVDSLPSGWDLGKMIAALCGYPETGEHQGGDGSGLTQAEVDARIAASSIAPPAA
jgi:hypothetical protein